jgi:hypothetical protein
MENLPAVVNDFFWNAFLPAALVLAALAVFGSIVRKIKRIIYPPNSMELHKEALIILQSSSAGSTSNTKQKQWAERQAKLLLHQAVEQDPRYEPAIWTLVALYLYRFQDPKSAIQLLSKSSFSSQSSQSQSLLLDAKVMADGQHQMIQAELRQMEFLSVSCVDPSFYAMACCQSTTTSVQDSDFQKKQK